MTQGCRESHPPARAAPAATLAISVLAVGLGAAPAFLFGFLAPVLQADLGVSRTQLGLLVGLFYGGTGLASILAGMLSELLGARWAIVLQLVMGAVSLLLPVALPGYPALVACSMVAGAAYALANSATNVAVAAVLPPGRHGVALAAKTAGVPALVAVNSLVTPGLGEQYGWRAVLLWTAPLLVGVAAAAAAVLPDARSPARATGDAPPVTLPTSFLRFPLAAFFFIGGSQALFSWAVPFLHEGGGLSPGDAGAITAAASLIAVGPMVVVARLSDRLGAGRRLPVVAALCGATAAGQLLLVAAGLTGGLAIAAAGLTVATVAQLAAVSLMHAAVIAAAPGAIGRASGVTMSGFYAGALISAPVFGLIVDSTGRYHLAWAQCAFMVLVAAAGFWWCRGIPVAGARVPATPTHSAADQPTVR